jgi:CheY-like chemotaxis protein
MKLFIVDDDLIYRMIISKTIDRIDSSLVIDECEDGAIGIAKLAQRSNSDEKIIVLLDINMPILDGWGFLDQMQKFNFYNIQDLVIYIVSSSTDESDILKAKQYKCVSGFFHKPLSTGELISIISME